VPLKCKSAARIIVVSEGIMSDDATKDLEIAVRLAFARQMKEALLSGDTEGAKKLAEELQEVEDQAAANPSRKSLHADAAPGKAKRPVKNKDASGKWIN
jgi:hypothetical protein